MIPFVHEAPPVALDVLEELLHFAPAAIPEALQIGHYLDVVESDDVYALVTRINNALGEELTDGRLIMQYAISILCMQQVYMHWLCNFRPLQVVLLFWSWILPRTMQAGGESASYKPIRLLWNANFCCLILACHFT